MDKIQKLSEKTIIDMEILKADLAAFLKFKKEREKDTQITFEFKDEDGSS